MINRASPRRSLVFILELLLNMLGHWFRAFFHNPWVPAPRGDSSADPGATARPSGSRSVSSPPVPWSSSTGGRSGRPGRLTDE